MSGFGGAVKLTGESEYKKALSSITQSLKEVDSEVKLVTSQFDKNDKSEAALTAQTDALTKKYDAQAQKVELMRKNYASLSDQAEKQKQKHKALGDALQSETDKLKAIEQESGKTSEEYKKQAEKVNALSADYVKSEQAITKNEQALSKARVELNNNEAALNKTASEINKLATEDKEATTANEKLGSSFKDAGDQAEKAGSKGVGAFTVALGNLVSSAITSAIKGLKDLGKAATDAFGAFDEGRDSIIFATGATGEEAEALQESYKKVASSVVADMNDIGKVIGEVSTRMGLTGDELETASESFLKFSKITGMDAKTAVQSVSRAMEKSGISDYNRMLDMLVTASQKSGVAVDRLTDSVTKYSVPMKNLGFTTTETISLFAQFEKNGVNVEQAFNGLQKAAANWAKDGKDASKEFEALMKEIKNAPSSIEGTQKAVEIFGSKTGAELADAIRSGKMEYSDMMKYISSSKGTLEKTFDGSIDATDKLKLAWQKMRLKLAEAVEKIVDKYGPDIEKAIDKIVPAVEDFVDKTLPKIFDGIKWLKDNLPTIIPIISGIVTAMTGLWIAQKLHAIAVAFGLVTSATQAQTAAQTGLNTAMSANPIGLVISLIAGLVVALVGLYNNCEEFRQYIDYTFGMIKEGAIATWEFFSELFTKTIPDALYKLGEGIVTKGSEILEFIGTMPAKIGTFLGSMAYDISQFAKNTASKAAQAGKDFFWGIIDKVSEVPGKVASFCSDIIGNVTSFASDMLTKAGEAGLNFFNGIWDEVKDLPSKFITLGEDIVKGIAKGLNNMWDWLTGQISSPCKKLVKDAKKALGIASPSKLFADGVGKNIALGIGVGFSKEMENVTRDMLDEIPTSFDVSPEVNGSATGASFGSGAYNYAELVKALKEALKEVDVVLDDRKLGQFVTKTITSEVYS